MEPKGQEDSLGDKPIFPKSETLDHLQQNPPLLDQDKPPYRGELFGGSAKKIDQKSSRFSLNPELSAPAPTTRTRYRECLKNHAAYIGGKALDGCGEFMPGGNDGSLEALKCAACNCHRNFHRKEPTDGGGGGQARFARSTVFQLPPLQLPPPLPSPSSLGQHQRISFGTHTSHWNSIAQPVKMTFGGGGGGGGGAGGGVGGTDSSSEDLNFNGFQSNTVAPPLPPPPPSSKKRIRVKFTAEQKERMLEFAEKVGWRILGEDDAEVRSFCEEVGVKRQVLRVWIQNNKNSVKKNRQQEQNHEKIGMVGGETEMDS